MLIQLASGSYQDRSLTASAQRCLNLFLEPIPSTAGEPIQFVHLPCAGLKLHAQAPENGCRGMYRSSQGFLYAVYGQSVFHIDDNNTFWNMGGLTPSATSDATPRTTPCYFSDNGLVLIVTDNSTDGWYADITVAPSKQVLNRIDKNINTGWYGSKYPSYMSTYFLFNKPNTNLMYISGAEVDANTFTDLFNVVSANIVAIGSGYTAGDILTINATNGAKITVNTVDSSGEITAYGVTNGGHVTHQPLNPVNVTGGTGSGATFNLNYANSSGAMNPIDFAGKSIMADNLVAVIPVHTVIWMIGEFSYECWFLSGGGATGSLSVNVFPFELIPSIFKNVGCAAPDSIATLQNVIFFLHQDASGRGIVLMGEGYDTRRISTFAIENTISNYDTIKDAIGYCYTSAGHIFYCLTFPSANNMRGATWVYDLNVGQWHERCWTDTNGVEWRHRAAFATECYGKVFCGDWENNNFYELDPNTYNDAGVSIKRLRSFPHLVDVDSNRRMSYSKLIANMDVGTDNTSSATIPTIRCDFDAPDGTLLDNFVGNGDIGASFTAINNRNEAGYIVNNGFTSSGPILYLVSGTPLSPDYEITFKVVPTAYGTVAEKGAGIRIIARGDNAGNGYSCSVVSDGIDYELMLGVIPAKMHKAQVSMNILSSGDFTITMNLTGSLITASVQRSQDGLWLYPDGSWRGLKEIAAYIVDTTYTRAGRVLLASGPFNAIEMDALVMHAHVGTVTATVH